MIETYDPRSHFVRSSLAALDAIGVASSVQLTIARQISGVYEVNLGRVRLAPAVMEGMTLGVVEDVPPGQRRATWLLTDAVQLALTNPEAHHLLHW